MLTTVEPSSWLLQLKIRKRNELEHGLNNYIISQLRDARAEAGYSQKELSKYLGRSASFIGQIECGYLGLAFVDLIGMSILFEKPIKYFSPIHEKDEKELDGQEWDLIRHFRGIEDEAIKEAAVKVIAQLTKVRKKTRQKWKPIDSKPCDLTIRILVL